MCPRCRDTGCDAQERPCWPALTQDGDVWVAYDPETDVYSQAETEDAARVAIREAVRLHCEVRGVLAERARCAKVARAYAYPPYSRAVSDACEEIAQAIERGES